MYNTGVSYNDPFVQYIISAAGQLSNVCFLIVMMIAILPMTQAALNMLFKGEEGFDFSPIWHLLTVCLLLTFYNEVMTAISAGIGGATEMIGVVLKAKTRTVTAPTSNGGVDHMSMYDYFTTETSTVMRSIFIYLSSGAISIGKVFIDRFRLVALAMTYLIGPIALTVSVIPGKKDSARIWFNAYFFIQCIAITMMLTDIVYVAYNDFHKQDEKNVDQFFMFVVMQLVFVGLYLLAAFFTTFFTGYSVAAGAITKLVSMSTTVATLAKSTLQSSSNAAGGLGKTLLNAPQTAVNAMQNVRDFKDKVSRSGTLAKQIIQDPKSTFGFKNHQAGI